MYYKYFNIISIILIIVISFVIIIYSEIDDEDTECFIDTPTLDDRVTTLEEKVDGINKQIDNKNPENRINKLENYISGINNVIDNFNTNDKDKYNKMYSWYARLTGNDPELIEKEDNEKKKKNQEKYKNMEEEMAQKYNKK